MNIFRDQFRRLDIFAGSNAAQEVQHLLGLVSMRKVKIDSILRFFDIECILVHTILQNKLLKVQECPLVRHLLPNLK